MKKANIIYWVFTGLFATIMLGASIPDIISMPMAVAGMGEIGYPAYFVPFIGVAKLLGVIAILVPGYPRIKEWAYAGLFFDLIGATYSIITAGKSPEHWVPMIIPLTLAAGSYVYYHKKLKLRRDDSKYTQPASGILHKAIAQ